MKSILLESHNINNLFFGFGQFNYHLLLGLSQYEELLEEGDINIILLAKNTKKWKQDFSKDFNYKKYFSLQRRPFFRIRKKYNLWHSLNQNTKIEPYYNIPYLLTVHDVNFMEENVGQELKNREKLFNEKLERSNAITYISKYAKKMTHQYFDVPNIPEYVIYNGSPENSEPIPISYEPKIRPSQPYLFSIGEFLEKKNLHTLVEMLVFLPEMSLVLAGKNTTKYAEKIKSTIDRLNLKSRVFITGKITEVEKNYYYQNCTAFVFPSLREGFGIPPIEAMKYGTPVFLSNRSSLPEVGGQSAFYWENFQPEYMADVVIKGIKEYKLNPEKFSNNLIQHANSYSWTETALKYIEVYKSLV